jgi:excisionase family DNA binding protein
MSKTITLTKMPDVSREELLFPKFLSVKKFVEATNVSRQTVSRKLKLGEIPYVKIGSRILIPFAFLVSLEKEAWASFKKMID